MNVARADVARTEIARHRCNVDVARTEIARHRWNQDSNLRGAKLKTNIFYENKN